MTPNPAQCLILACGNTLRGDDGVGPWLAEWAEKRFSAEASVRVLARQQWTPELAQEIAHAESVVFIDCSVNTAPGMVELAAVAPANKASGLATHHLDAAQLLSLGYELYNSLPHNAMLLTIGAGSTELSEEFSPAVTATLPHACSQLEETVLQLLGESKRQ